jgi:hypothetical protein
MPTSKSVLFFSGLLFKREFLYLKKEGANTKEIEEKVNTNFLKLFQPQDLEMLDGY